MPDVGLRGRVERLLRGDLRSDDLTRLFLFARDRCDGRESVQEIGDFVAHHDERTKGLITRTTRDWATTALFVLPNMNSAVAGWKLPANFSDFLWASFRRVGSAYLRDYAALTRAEAQRLLPAIIGKFKKNPDGTISLGVSESVKERELVNCLCNVLISKPAFKGDRLFDDFQATMKSHGLLQKSEMKSFERVKPAISLFAVTVMHNCTVRATDGTALPLTAAANPDGDEILVVSTVPINMPGIGKQFVASPIYSVSLRPADFCDPELLRTRQPWTFELEVTPSSTLAKLQ